MATQGSFFYSPLSAPAELVGMQRPVRAVCLWPSMATMGSVAVPGPGSHTLSLLPIPTCQQGWQLLTGKALTRLQGEEWKAGGLRDA